MIPWRYSFLELLHGLPPSGCPNLFIACVILSLEVQHGLPHSLCLNLVLSMPMVSVTECVRQITTHRQPLDSVRERCGRAGRHCDLARLARVAARQSNKHGPSTAADTAVAADAAIAKDTCHHE